MQPVPRTPTGTGVLWYFVGDELFLTHPGLGYAGEGTGSISTTPHTSWVTCHFPLWPHMPEIAGAPSLPHHGIHSSSSSLSPQHRWSGLKPVCPSPPPHLSGFCTPQAGSCGSLTPTPRSLWGGLCPGFRACPALSTLLGQAQVGSGGLAPRGLTGTPVSLHWALRVSHPTPVLTVPMSSSRHLPIRRGRGAHFPPARGTLALLSFFLSVSSFRQFPRERFLPFVSQLESRGPRSCLEPLEPPK